MINVDYIYITESRDSTPPQKVSLQFDFEKENCYIRETFVPQMRVRERRSLWDFFFLSPLLKKSGGFFFIIVRVYYICKTNDEDMNMTSHNIKIQHEKFGTLLNETFVNGTQFKLFLKMIQGSIELKNDLTFFNGVDFFVHIPFKHLVESIITTNVDTYTLAEHLINKSKIEAEVTK